jgi:nucleoside-diphosphate-sugar epimerase
MHVIVTGGSGFIGSHAVKELRRAGHRVSVVDIAPLHDLEEVTFCQESVLDAGRMAAVIRDAGAVVHLAGYVREEFRRDPHRGTMLQVEGTCNVLEACRANQVPHIVLASSFYVFYGIPGDRSVDEETSPDPLRIDLFGATKLMAEQLCREYTRKYGLHHTILRFGSAYGAGGSNAIRTFIEGGLEGRVLDVWGSGRRKNQYTYVGDLAAGIASAIKVRDQTFNLTSPEVTTTGELAALMRSEFGFDFQLDPSRPEEESFPFVSSVRAMDLLNWRPVDLKHGLQQTLREISNDPLRAVNRQAATPSGSHTRAGH